MRAPTEATIAAWPTALAGWITDASVGAAVRVGSASAGASLDTHHETRTHHRHHWPGRLLSRRALAREGLRGARGRAAKQLVQHRAHRPPLPRSTRAGRPAPAPLR